ncbi:MAG: AAA family ATPase [Bacteroidetes bacterium]|nr:AAA family ATPase [Bacteroidota bacterium]
MLFTQTEDQIFVLKGYAGTGKTTLLKGVLDYLESLKTSVIAMAPTGRAARVLGT